MEQYAFHTLFLCHFCFMDIYLNGCNNGADINREDGVEMYLFYSCQRWRAQILLSSLFFGVFFFCSSQCGVAAAALLAKDEPINRISK